MRNKALLCVFAALCLLPLSAQERDSVMTVEEAYLGSAEGMIMRELALSSEFDSKMTALQYIEGAIDGGGASSELIGVLCSLAGDGMLTIVREGGRIVNNYPEIRIRACNLLGSTGAQEAVQTLISLLYVETEASVASAAVRALANIGYNDDGRPIEMINWVARKFDVTSPSSSLAMEVLNAYEKLPLSAAEARGVVEIIVRIASNTKYTTATRQRAYEVLDAVWLGGGAEEDY